MARRAFATATALAVAAVPVVGAIPADAGTSKGGGDKVKVVTEGLDGPRGVDHVGRGMTVVAQADGTISLVVAGGHHRSARKAVRRWDGSPSGRSGGARVYDLTQVPAGFLAPAVSVGPKHTLWILTVAGEPGTGAATLYKWRPWWDEPKPYADIAAYQATDPDPFDQEDFPEDSNPYGVHALKDGTVLVADAAGNDLLRVTGKEKIHTVARVKTRTIEVPDGFPPEDPFGNPLPPSGTPIPSEAVTTSVTEGPGGWWYVGELRGFPGNAGTAQIWKIRPGTKDAVCDPEDPWAGPCKRYADGMTSLVDLSARGHKLYALSLSKIGWLQLELEVPGAEVGGLFKVWKEGRRTKVREVAEDQLIIPGGVDAGRGGTFVTGPIFGPGALVHVR